MACQRKETQAYTAFCWTLSPHSLLVWCMESALLMGMCLAAKNRLCCLCFQGQKVFRAAELSKDAFWLGG